MHNNGLNMRTEEEKLKRKLYDSKPETRKLRRLRDKIYRANPEVKERKKLYRKSNAKKELLRHKFGITLEQYRVMFDNQQGCCKTCHRPQSEFKRAFAVDHNHKTGKIRGLLCSNCNTTLGKCKDNPEILLNLINYLKDN